MSNNSSSSSSGGIGFFGMLTIAFIVLKLTDVIDWSWWWVLSPLAAPVVIILVVLAVGFVPLVFFGLWDKITSGRKVKFKK